MYLNKVKTIKYILNRMNELENEKYGLEGAETSTSKNTIVNQSW